VVTFGYKKSNNGCWSNNKHVSAEEFSIAYKLALVFTIVISSGMVALGLVIARDQTRML